MVSIGVIHSTTSRSSSTSLPSDLSTQSVDSQKEETLGLMLTLDEILIVLVIIIFWIIAVMAFIKKWDSIRIMQPMEPRYKHNPKNLESIKIVKRAQDSVIYKNYSRKMSTTMVAREKRRLQRMHTVPCMNTLPAIHLERLPTIPMEMTTEM